MIFNDRLCVHQQIDQIKLNACRHVQRSVVAEIHTIYLDAVYKCLEDDTHKLIFLWILTDIHHIL